MAKTKKILFYSDSKIYGGHEIMSARIANSLLDYKVHFIYHNKNLLMNFESCINFTGSCSATCFSCE